MKTATKIATVRNALAAIDQTKPFDEIAGNVIAAFRGCYVTFAAIDDTGRDSMVRGVRNHPIHGPALFASFR